MAANSRRRLALHLIAAMGGTALAALSFPAASQPSSDARQGIDYRLIPPQPVPPGGVIEVVEFFWYGCPYCDQLQPRLAAWLRRQPGDVALRLVPAVFRESWRPHARLYYTLESLGEVERLHQQVYESYHGERQALSDESGIADWAARHGIDRERWLAAFRSEEVDRKVADAREQLVRYQVAGTPSVVVDGRYLTSSGMTPGVAAMIPILDALVATVRAERGSR